METLTGFLIVCVGAGIGGMLRHGVTLAALRLFGVGFPYGTLAVNVVGSAVMGLAVGVFAARHVESAHLRLFVATGLLGGFTTFSSFSLDSLALWERGQPFAAIGYVASSLILSLLFLSAFMLASRRWGGG